MPVSLELVHSRSGLGRALSFMVWIGLGDVERENIGLELAHSRSGGLGRASWCGWGWVWLKD